MAEKQFYWVISVGNREDWRAGRGSAYIIKGGNGAKVLPVFTTQERAEHHVDKYLSKPEAHMQLLESVLESTDVARAEPLTAGRFTIVPFDTEMVAEVVDAVGVDYLVCDFRPGWEEQEILRFEEE